MNLGINDELCNYFFVEMQTRIISTRMQVMIEPTTIIITIITPRAMGITIK